MFCAREKKREFWFFFSPLFSSFFERWEKGATTLLENRNSAQGSSLY